MNLRATRVAVLAAAVTGVVSIRANAQSTRYPFLVLQLPASTRMLAVGDMGVAGRDDDVLFYNPAQLVVARGMSGSLERLSATSSSGALSSVTRFNSGGIAVGMRSANYQLSDNVFPASRGSALGSGATEATALEASVGFAQVFKGVRWGVAAKYAEENIPARRFTRAMADVGLSKDLMRFYTVGLSVQNLGASFATGGSSLDLPTRATLGAAMSHQLGEFDFAGTAGVSTLRFDTAYPAGGAELGYSWLDGYSIALRAGARRPRNGEQPLTAGAGFNVDRLSIDYALEALSGSRLGHRIGLRIR